MDTTNYIIDLMVCVNVVSSCKYMYDFVLSMTTKMYHHSKRAFILRNGCLLMRRLNPRDNCFQPQLCKMFALCGRYSKEFAGERGMYSRIMIFLYCDSSFANLYVVSFAFICEQ